MQDEFRLPPIVDDVIRQVDDKVRSPNAAEVNASWQVLAQRVAAGSDEPAVVVARSSARADRAGSTFRAQTLRERPVLGSRAWRRRSWSTLAGFATIALAIVATWRLGGLWSVHRLTASNSAYTVYATANGQRATITLPDGNTVALNVASRLEVPVNYSAGNHVVRLSTGEAAFTVSHHVGTPFTVVSGATSARVLGTSFLVRHYRTDSTVMIAVGEGKVAVGATVITARHLVEINKTGMMHVQVANPAQFAFAAGVLSLDNMQLSNAIPELNRWYDVDIQLGDPTLANRMVQGRLPAGSVSDLIEVLQAAVDVRVVRNRRVLTLYPRHQ